MRQQQSGGQIYIYTYTSKGQSRRLQREAVAPVQRNEQLQRRREHQATYRLRRNSRIPLRSLAFSSARARARVDPELALTFLHAPALTAGTATAAAAAATRRQAETAAAAGWGTEAPLLCFKAAVAPVTACHLGAPAFSGAFSSSLSSLHSLIAASPPDGETVRSRRQPYPEKGMGDEAAAAAAAGLRRRLPLLASSARAAPLKECKKEPRFRPFLREAGRLSWRQARRCLRLPEERAAWAGGLCGCRGRTIPAPRYYRIEWPEVE